MGVQISRIFAMLHWKWFQIGDSGALGELSFRENGRRQGYVIGIYGLAMSGLIQVWHLLVPVPPQNRAPQNNAL